MAIRIDHSCEFVREEVLRDNKLVISLDFGEIAALLRNELPVRELLPLHVILEVLPRRDPSSCRWVLKLLALLDSPEIVLALGDDLAARATMRLRLGLYLPELLQWEAPGENPELALIDPEVLVGIGLLEDRLGLEDELL